MVVAFIFLPIKGKASNTCSNVVSDIDCYHFFVWFSRLGVLGRYAWNRVRN